MEDILQLNYPTRQLLTGHHNQIGATAGVFDEVGGYEGIGAAEFLVEQGARVTYVTSLGMFAPRMMPAGIVRPALERLNAKGMVIGGVWQDTGV